jgi:hypothetical protein
MPWPEKTLTSRFLAGIVSAVLGAFFGPLVVVVWLRHWTTDSPTIVVLIACAAGAGIGFICGFCWGDPAVRALMRLISGRWPAA